MTSETPVFGTRILPHALAIAVAAAGCVGVSFWAKNLIEHAALTDVSLVLSQAGHEWAGVSVDGLSVTLTGTAPDEATRFAARSAAGSVLDASRVVDGMNVTAAAAIVAPAFSIEVLKNTDGISLIGLVPLASDPATIVERVQKMTEAEISDLLESAEFAPPEGWEQALEFGIEAIEALPRSKVSIMPSVVAITAVAKDADDKKRLERKLNRDAPAGLKLKLNITAPRPVVAPFTLRFLIGDNGVRFDACTADSEAAMRAILAAAFEAGLTDSVDCVLGLGTPSTRWGEAAVAGIAAIKQLGFGTVTFSNADVSLVGTQGKTSQSAFDRVAGELEGALPPVFSLSAVLPRAPEQMAEGETAPPAFSATRSPEGNVQLRGRLGDEATRAAVQNYAAALFGVEKVYPATRLGVGVPPGWPKRVLAALEALSYLHSGVATVTVEDIRLSGASGRQDAQSEMARILSDRLESGASFHLDVTYSEALDPLAALPSPDECIELLNEAANKQKITFAPSSTKFEKDAVQTIDAIAEILRDCQSVRIEIGGHTDSQGREVMNEQLSQSRADAVLNAIMARRVLVSNLSAKGYGESRPIADNDTDAGREANRRIEFQLFESGAEPAENTEENAAEGDTTPGAATDAETTE